MNTRGSEWKKWDLHVHTPDTKMENNYKIRDIPKDYIKITKEKYANYIKGDANALEDKDFLWLYWIDIIHNSDVEVIGVTDYFSLNQYTNAMKYYDLYLNINNIRAQKNINRKIFFPNMELRAPHTVNRSHKYINFHFIFNPDKMNHESIDDILGDIKIKFGIDRKEGTKSLKYITSKNAEDVTVELDTAIDTLTNIFGEYFEDSVKIITSGKKDGLTTNGLESSRNMKILDGYADITDGIFSMTPNDREHWLEKGKPTFGGSDAHSFPNLLKKLGKHGKILHENGDTKESWKTTWVKAEPTFEGFKQVFIEPDERVKIQEQEPDIKSNYAWIKEVQFDAPVTFPEKIVLNRNLNSIIGSRSSGKSALLGYISQAVGNIPEENSEELAAGISWEKAKDMKCSVLWADGDKTTHELNEGQKSVIYIPQNHLFNIASDPERVTSTIQKTLYTVHSESKKKIDLFDSNEKQYREDIRRTLDKYFELVAKFEDLQSQKKGYPALRTLEEDYKNQEIKLNDLRKQNHLTEDESKLVTSLKNRIGEIEDTILKKSLYSSTQAPTVDVTGMLNNISIPEGSDPCMVGEINIYLQNTINKVSEEVTKIYKKYYNKNIESINELQDELNKIKTLHKELLDKSEATPMLETENARLYDLKNKIKIIKELDIEIINTESEAAEFLQSLTHKINHGDDIIKEAFGEKNIKWIINKTEISPTVGYSDDYLINIESHIDKRSIQKIRDYTDNTSKKFSINGIISTEDGNNIKSFVETIMCDPKKFLEDQQGSKTRVVNLKGYKGKSNPLHSFMEDILVSPREVRLSAEYEEDYIGGYKKSTMTPGKQAIFALELILANANSEWPLLIDQPEDDLDSRSIYYSVVSALRELKKKRQIIMVTHDANLVIGSDSEEVIVVNRNGADRPNADGKFFNYATGSLENTKKKGNNCDTLSSQGIREHCCEILDGGEEAFQKRQSKYNI
jgi:hypothetical protein